MPSDESWMVLAPRRHLGPLAPLSQLSRLWKSPVSHRRLWTSFLYLSVGWLLCSLIEWLQIGTPYYYYYFFIWRYPEPTCTYHMTKFLYPKQGFRNKAFCLAVRGHKYYSLCPKKRVPYSFFGCPKIQSPFIFWMTKMCCVSHLPFTFMSVKEERDQINEEREEMRRSN